MTLIQNDTPHLTEELAAMAEQLRRCTVQVRNHRSSGGSGVIWERSGLIITNAHVVRADNATVELSDGRVMDAVVTARDPQRDLAALRVEATDLPTAIIGDSDALRVGELVLAVGNPLGLVGALTTGIVHARSRQGWVMADVRLAPGNSGGLLANARGEAIAINTMIAGGLALAIPSKTVEHFLSGTPARPYLGVTLQPVPILLENRRVLGLLVLEVQPSSPAESAGLLVGDVLIGVRSQVFTTPADLTNILWSNKPGELLSLECLRGGKRFVCHVDVFGSTFEVKSA